MIDVEMKLDVATLTVSPLSPCGLRDSHILHSHCKMIAFGPVDEFSPACSHGLWTWRLVIAIPSAETSGDPGQPGQRTFGMRGLLAWRLALEWRADRFVG